MGKIEKIARLITGFESQKMIPVQWGDNGGKIIENKKLIYYPLSGDRWALLGYKDSPFDKMKKLMDHDLPHSERTVKSDFASVRES